MHQTSASLIISFKKNQRDKSRWQQKLQQNLSPTLSAGKTEMESCSASGLDSALECRCLLVHCRRLLHADLDDSSWVCDSQVLTVAQTSHGTGSSEISWRHQAHLWFGTKNSNNQWLCQSLCMITTLWTRVSFGEWCIWKARLVWRMYCINLLFPPLSAETSFPVEVFPHNKENPEHMGHMVNLQDTV